MKYQPGQLFKLNVTLYGIHHTVMIISQISESKFLCYVIIDTGDDTHTRIAKYYEAAISFLYNCELLQ